MEVLIETINGKIFKCSKCDAVHIEYKNLNFNFKEEEFWKFASYIQNLDGKQWEERNRYSDFTRKIILPVGSGNFNVLLNREEVEEFKRLLRFQNDALPCQQVIRAGNMEFTSILN